MRRLHATEHDLQKSIISWWSYACNRYSLEPAHLIAIPNGGARNRITGARLKAEGVRAGVPDLMLPVARGKAHGLFVELKTNGGKVSPMQVIWQRRLQEQGYEAVVAWGADAAIRYIEDYLRLEK